MFYAKDYKFTAVWKHPESVLTAQPSVIIEPNFSTSQDMPAAVALYGIFRKRWLARYWQMRGVQIVVDLCVAERFTELNLLGVPVGWSSFATRVMRGHHNAVEQHYAAACRRAKGTPKLFVVCGGGQTWQTTCQQRGWLWIPEQMSEVRLARKARELEKSGEVVA